jgi:hypothetical protein
MTALAAVLAGATPAAAMPARAPAPDPAGVALLPTGDAVRLAGTAARPQVHVLPAARSGIGGAALTFTSGGDVYVVPASARPYLGRLLDPGLFDVSRLIRAGLRGRVPVRLALAPGAVPSLPGVTITSRVPGAASGYLTRAGARRFGAALAAQWRADARTGWPAQSALFAGIAGMRLDVAAAPVVRPAFPMRTLIIHVLDEKGKPAPFVDALVMNVDDARKAAQLPFGIDGEARVSVPLGNYAIVTDVAAEDAATGDAVERIVALTQVAFTGDLQTVTLDARTATARPQVTTPNPAETVDQSIDWQRGDAAGTGFADFSFEAGAGVDFLVAPQPAPTVGTLSYGTEWSLAHEPRHGVGYVYELAYRSPDIPADQHHVVATADLARTDARYATDVAHRNAAAGIIAVQADGSFSGVDLPLRVPNHRIEYVNAAGAPAWTAEFLPNVDNPDDPFAGFVDDAERVLTAGERRHVDWMRAPLAVGVATFPEADAFPPAAPFCPACRTRDRLALLLAPVLDTTPGHVGGIDLAADGSPVARLRVVADGRTLLDEADELDADIAVPRRTTSYRVVADVRRSQDGFVGSTRSHVEWRFRSYAGAGRTIPASFTCSVDPAASCRVLPLLQARVDLPVSLTGTVPSGTSSGRLAVAPIQGATPARVSFATFALSADDGRTWHAVPVHALAQGRFSLRLENPSRWAGRRISIRIRAGTVDGSTLDETVLRAYAVVKR